MANLDAAFGLRPVGTLNGASWNGRTQRFYIPSTDTNAAVYRGSLVKLTGGGYDEGNGSVVPIVTGNVSSADAVVGVVTSVDPETEDSLIYRANSTSRFVNVCTDPNMIYAVQEDSVSSTLAAGAMGATANLTGFTSGSTVTGLSAIEIDSSTLSEVADTDDDVLIVGFDKRPDNEIGANAVWLVRLNNHAYVDAATGV